MNLYGKILMTIGLIIAAIVLWLVSPLYPGLYLPQISLSLFAISIGYLFVGILLGDILFRRIKDDKTRYSLNKVSTILTALVILLLLLWIWVTDLTAFIVALGVIGAGIAIALQDVFKNFVGGILILANRMYEVGDRIEIGGEIGDVIDIGVMSTTLLELGAWVHGDQPTGRVTLLPNGKILTQQLHNYTKDHSFIWDELTIPITYASDWERAKDIILTIVRQDTAETTKRAEADIERLGERYYFSRRVVEPMVYITPTDNWITFNVRYVTLVRDRRIFRAKLYEHILRELQKAEGISISSSTVTVTVVKPPESPEQK